MNFAELAASPISDVDSSEATALCGSCPHPMHVHDAISLRYCAATSSTALTRGCICRGGMADLDQAAPVVHRVP
jgi:hypothetical protein